MSQPASSGSTVPAAAAASSASSSSAAISRKMPRRVLPLKLARTADRIIFVGRDRAFRLVHFVLSHCLDTHECLELVLPVYELQRDLEQQPPELSFEAALRNVAVPSSGRNLRGAVQIVRLAIDHYIETSEYVNDFCSLLGYVDWMKEMVEREQSEAESAPTTAPGQVAEAAAADPVSSVPDDAAEQL